MPAIRVAESSSDQSEKTENQSWHDDQLKQLCTAWQDSKWRNWYQSSEYLSWLAEFHSFIESDQTMKNSHHACSEFRIRKTLIDHKS